jgi:hypothetical protein
VRRGEKATGKFLPYVFPFLSNAGFEKIIVFGREREMKQLVKICAVAVTILAISGVAQATTINHPLSWWSTAGTQTIDGYSFTFIGSSLGSGNMLSVDTSSSWPGQVFVKIGSGNNVASSNLDYTIAIASGAFTNASISVDRSIPLPLTITKKIAEEPAWSLTSLDGASNAKLIPGNHNLLTVHETMDGYWSGTTNVFTSVPEPATMCLLGLGAIGLLRRRA